MKVILNICTKHRLFVWCILLLLGIQTVNASDPTDLFNTVRRPATMIVPSLEIVILPPEYTESSSTISSFAANTDTANTIRRPTFMVTPAPEHAGISVTAPHPFMVNRLKHSSFTPEEIIKNTIPLELRCLTYIVERVSCKDFELYNQSIFMKPTVLACLLTHLTRNNPRDALPAIKAILQEYGYMATAGESSPIVAEIKDQAQRLKCMNRIIKLLPTATAKRTRTHYSWLSSEPSVDTDGFPYTNFTGIPTTKPAMPLRQLRKKLKLFTNKEQALTALEKSRKQIALLF